MEWPEVVEEPKAAKPAGAKGSGTTGGVFLYTESVKVSPVLRSLWNTLVIEEKLEDPFDAWIERSTLLCWSDRGYRPVVAIELPDQRLAEVK